MFYENQPIEQQNEYKQMLTIIGNLTLLFSESDCPYLPYRAHENIFCKYFKADNLARSDCSADAKKGRIGIGLKTWMGGDDQKVAEFGKLKEQDASSDIVQLQVKKLQDFISEHYYNCSKEILSELGKMYASGGEFTENIDKYGGEGTAEFTAKAISIYCTLLRIH